MTPHRKVLVLDTSVLCCWLKVPGRETAGPLEDRWTPERIASLVEEETAQGSALVLPIASLIETGNHIAQAPAQRYECAVALARHIAATADAASPWAAFTEQSTLWEPEKLKAMAAEWPGLAKGGLSIGDATIKQVVEHYTRAGFRVQILTGDAGLKAYEPSPSAQIPRRRGG